MSDCDYWSLTAPKGKSVTKPNPSLRDTIDSLTLTYAELEQALGDLHYGKLHTADVYARVVINREQRWTVGDVVLSASGWVFIRTLNDEWENPFTKELGAHDQPKRPLRLIGRAV